MSAKVVQLRPSVAFLERERELTSAIGMMIALGSWAMMFGALFFVYLALRAQAIAWPPPGLPALPLLLPTVNTAVMLSSSFTLAHALRELRRGVHQRAFVAMVVTFLLGAIFVALQAWLWNGMWNAGLTTSTGTLGTVFYGLTVLHALHVVAGLAVLGYLVAVARRQTRSLSAMGQQVISLRLCGMFWHFVGAVWIVMFVGLFLT